MGRAAGVEAGNYAEGLWLVLAGLGVAAKLRVITQKFAHLNWSMWLLTKSKIAGNYFHQLKAALEMQETS